MTKCNWDKNGWQGGNTCDNEATEKCFYDYETREGNIVTFHTKEYFVCSSHRTILKVMMYGTN